MMQLLKGAATSRMKKKNSKKYNIGVIDLKFTQYIPMMVSDIVYKWESDQTSMTSIIEIEIWNLVWLNRSLLTNDHLAFCDYFHQSWNMRSWFCLPGENVFLHIKAHVYICFWSNKSVTFYSIKNYKVTVCNDYIYLYSLQISDKLNEKLFFNDFPTIWNLSFQYGHSKFGSGTVIKL